MGMMTEEATNAALFDEVIRLRNRVAELEALINSPQTTSWIDGARLEAAHQVERWGKDHDANKTPWDWYWLIGHLAQKAAVAGLNGDVDKAKHHTISTAAALLNWHQALSGTNHPEVNRLTI